MHMPTPDEFETMKESLKFKTDELKKSEVTAQNLISERAKIYDNLQVFKRKHLVIVYFTVLSPLD